MKNKSEFLFSTVELILAAAIGVIPTLPGVSIAWLAVPGGGIVVSKFIHYRTSIKDGHKHIREQLEVLVALLPEGNDGIRCTYHVPVGVFRKRLLQVCDYLPNGGGGGRKFPRSKGIIGAAFRDKKMLVENFHNDSDYRDQMKLKYNYTTQEIGERAADRRSYLCSPILDENHKVLGLVYFDSDTYGTFELNGSPQITMITTTCDVIRTHLL